VHLRHQPDQHYATDGRYTEVVSIERNEVIIDRETVLEEEHIDEILESGVQNILLFRFVLLTFTSSARLKISRISLSFSKPIARNRVVTERRLCCISTVSCVMLIRLMTQVHVKLLTTSSSRK